MDAELEFVDEMTPCLRNLTRWLPALSVEDQERVFSTLRDIQRGPGLARIETGPGRFVLVATDQLLELIESFA